MKIREKWLGYHHTVFVGKFKNCNVTIDRDGNGSSWYFYLSRTEDDLRHNSLWDGKNYDTKELCAEAAELWIKENAPRKLFTEKK